MLLQYCKIVGHLAVLGIVSYQSYHQIRKEPEGFTPQATYSYLFAGPPPTSPPSSGVSRREFLVRDRGSKVVAASRITHAHGVAKIPGPGSPKFCDAVYKVRGYVLIIVS